MSSQIMAARSSLAVGETVILMTPPFISLLKHLLNVEGAGGAAEGQSRRRLVQPGREHGYLAPLGENPADPAPGGADGAGRGTVSRQGCWAFENGTTHGLAATPVENLNL